MHLGALQRHHRHVPQMLGRGMSAQVEQSWQAWCEECDEGEGFGLTRVAAEEWAAEHNDEWHPKDAS